VRAADLQKEREGKGRKGGKVLRSRILRLAAAVILAVATASVITAAGSGTALAASSHATASASAAQVVIPALTSCPIQVGEFRVYASSSCGNGTFFLSGCTAGTKGNLPFIPRYASNGCRSRAWLYTASNEGGFGLCLNKISATNYLHTDYKSFKVVSNTASC
jgi:hypothetical protein